MAFTAFTIVAQNYLSLALTLGDSLRVQHPDAKFVIFITDGCKGLPELRPAHELRAVDDYLGEDLASLKFVYNVTEYCTAVKPALFRQLFREVSDEVIFYLDPDTLLLDRLDAVTASAPQASIYLAPHLLTCRPQDDHAYPEHKHLWEGIFNLGFCCLRRGVQTDRFLAWWDARLRKYCFADYFDGLHTDQKWMDYVPAYFPRATKILELPGVNVAHWNLDERPLSVRDGRYQAGGQPLILFHFSGFDFRGDRLTRHVSDETQWAYLTPEVRALAARYRAAVHANGFDAYIRLPYEPNAFSNGKPVTALHRRLYRQLALADQVGNPFDSKGRYYRSLARHGLLDESAAARSNYKAASLPSLGRTTRIVEAGLRQFLRWGGGQRYGYLLKMFAKYGRPENHVFLIADDFSDVHPSGRET